MKGALLVPDPVAIDGIVIDTDILLALFLWGTLTNAGCYVKCRGGRDG